MINIKNIQPKLWFNGINSEISYLKLKSFSVVKCGKTPSTKNELFWHNGTIPFVTPTDIINARINKTERFVTTDGWKVSQKAITGSIFVTCVASIGKNSMCDNDSAFNQQINNVYSNIYNNKYLYYLMNKNEQLIKSKASKSATQIIKKSDFENIEFYLTTNIEEQTKIANFFTLLDKQIQLIERKLELYELRKKYYLNNMFCDDDSNLPKLRFEGFKDILNLNKAKEISEIFGAGIDKLIIDGQREIKLVNFINVFKNTIINSEMTFMKSTCTEGEYSKYRIKFGDILLTPSSEDKINIGVAAMINIEDTEDLIYSYHLNLIRFKKETIVPTYISYYLRTNMIKKYFYSVSQGATRYTLSKKNFEDILINYPSLDEQTKIGNLFFSLDESIQNLKNQKDQLTKRKTYYLNNMFV